MNRAAADDRIHPVANIFPLMTHEEMDDLREDIEINGLLEPIWIHHECGRVIDGRHRAMACEALGIEPETRTWRGEEQGLVPFVVSLNMRRRHMTTGQKAVAALAAEKLEAGRAKKRRGGDRTSEQYKESIGPNSAQCSDEGRSAEKAAALFGIGKTAVKTAKAIERDAPDLLAEVESGAITLHSASLEARRRGRKASVASLKAEHPTSYNVILADPPWSYSNTGTEGAALKQYETMSTSELCDFVQTIDVEFQENAVLFVWVTNPLVVDALSVIDSWGFNYKTNLAWFKTELKSPGVGWYVRGQHELLFIATRGSFTPLERKATTSVLHTIPRMLLSRTIRSNRTKRVGLLRQPDLNFPRSLTRMRFL